MRVMTHLDDLRERVQNWWPLARAAREDFLPFDCPEISTQITELDAKSFIRGLDSEPPIFRVEDGYKLYSPLLPRLASGTEKQFNLMERQGQSRVSIRDETIVHYGVAAELIQEWGWPARLVESEPRLGNLTDGSLDLVVYREAEGGREVFLAVEAKGDTGKLARLVAGVNSCQGAPSPRHTPTDHKKCEGLLLVTTEWFWGVAAGPTRLLYRVSIRDGLIHLTLDERDEILEFA